MDVAAWLRGLGLDQYAPAFRDNDVDGEVLPELTADDLIGLGVTSIGHRRKLLAAIAALGAAAPTGAPAESPAPDDLARVARTPRPPEHLADKIRQARPALEGERKHITVLFADVKGSMNLAERFDPEQWFQIVEDFFQVVADGVHRFEGTVNQFTGDGVMALFGAPIAHEDHAQRACLAALHIRDAVRAFAESVRDRHGVQFDIRIGLNSGEVMIGRISDDLSMDYTALGHDVGVAQRMEALAEPGHICLSEQTARLVEGYFQLRDRGRVEVKGVAEPVAVFELEGTGTYRTRLDRSRARGLSAFVGRDRDMTLLQTALERARSGGQVLGIMAEAGTGKSRLCAEFLGHCRAQGLSVLEGRGVAHGKAIPMLPILELWRAYYGITEADTPERTRAKISGRLLAMDQSYGEDLPIIFDLFGVPDPVNPAPAIDPEQRQKRLHNVVKRVFRDPAHSAAGTRVLVLEDLHWFDGASDAFLETTVESIPASRDLLLVNFRPEYQARWMQRSHYQHLPLQPLTYDAIRDLVRDHLGQDPSVAALPEMVEERTKGNPFFIEEMLQSLIESGHLTGVRGAYRLTAPVTSLDVPASVQAVLASRIDRLAEREKQALQTASVIGKQFSETLLRQVLASIAPLDEVALDQALSALVAAEFLYEAAVYPQVEYSFKHPLTQEVAQRSQLHARRVRVHAAVAQALEGAGGNLDERAAEIARHWADAEEKGRAALWHRRAAEWAGLADLREAMRNWRLVRELAAGALDTVERTALSLRACQEIFQLSWRLGGSEEEFASVFAEGRALAEQIGDRPALAIMVGFYGAVRGFVGGSASDYVRYAEEAAGIAAACDDPALRAAVGTLLMFGHYFTGNGPAVLAWSDRVIEDTGSDNAVGKRITGYSPRCGALYARAAAKLYLGRLAESWRESEEVARLAEESGEFEVLAWVLHISGLLAHATGIRGPVLEVGRRCLEIAEKLDNDNNRVLGYFTLGTAYLIEARFTEARDALRVGAAIVRDRRTVFMTLPWILAVLAEAHLALGEYAEALAAAQEGINRGRDGGCPYYEACAQIALAQISLTSEGDVPRAKIEAALDRAEKLVTSIDGRSLSPRILELRGRLAAVLGDTPAADQALREALDLYRTIGATGHAERLAREIAA
jgi:class 3 adenylate cyclase/tetratricopeptide (TPR) repeat protein